MFDQFNRFEDMLVVFGPAVAYLAMKCETRTLTIDDVDLAKNVGGKSTMVTILCSTLEKEPDLKHLEREGVNGISFDLKMDPEKHTAYLRELGLIPPTNVWGDDEMERRADGEN